MGLIKQSAAAAPVVRFSLRDIEAQAKTILDDARREAARIMEQARKDASDLHADTIARGHEHGWEQGFHKGKDAGQDRAFSDCGPRAQEALTALETTAAQIAAARNEIEANILADVVELAIAIAQRITKRAGLVDPNVLAENLREAMKLVVRSNGIRVAIHPVQAEVLNQLLPALKLQWPALANVEIVHDETVTPGGCRVCTSHGEINADLQAQLDRLALELRPDRTADGQT